MLTMSLDKNMSRVQEPGAVYFVNIIKRFLEI